MTTAIDALTTRGWKPTTIPGQRGTYAHAAHPGHIVAVNTAGAWVHHERYSTGYKIHARSVDASRLAAHLDASRSLTGA